MASTIDNALWHHTASAWIADGNALAELAFTFTIVTLTGLLLRHLTAASRA